MDLRSGLLEGEIEPWRSKKRDPSVCQKGEKMANRGRGAHHPRAIA